jgi:hypothetical protein
MRSIQVVHAGRHYFIGGIYGNAGSLQEHLKAVAQAALPLSCTSVISA